MLQQITQLIQEVTSKDLKSSQIAPELQGKVGELTATSVVDGLKDSLSSGSGLGALTSLFQTQGQSNIASNPIVGSIVKQLVSSLSGKLGLSETVANGFASLVVPNIVGAISSKVSSGAEGFQISDILSSLGGNSDGKSGILGALQGDKSAAASAIGGALKGLFK